MATLPLVLVVVQRAVIMVDVTEHFLNMMFIFGMVRMVIWQVRRMQNCMLMEVHRLNIMLIIELVVQLWVVANMLAIMVHTVEQMSLISKLFVGALDCEVLVMVRMVVDSLMVNWLLIRVDSLMVNRLLMSE